MKNARKNEELTLFQQCAEFILPWLRPSELASVALTCQNLNILTKSVTSRRSSDASRNLEKLPIPFVNDVDDHPYAYFSYTPTQILPLDDEPSHFRQPWGDCYNARSELVLQLTDPFPLRVEDARGCDCERCDDDSGCPCWDMNLGELTWECGPNCRCGLGCGNRVPQRGIGVRLNILKDRRKGWGLYAGELIQEGQFVCEYAGMDSSRSQTCQMALFTLCM